MLYNINETSQSSYNLLQNILDWSTLQKGEISVNKKVFGLNDKVSDVINDFKSIAEKKGVTVVNSIPNNTLVLSDENILRLVVRNFLSNAVKYSYPEGEVLIHTEEVDGEVSMGHT